MERFARLNGEDLSDAPHVRDLLVAAQRRPGAQDEIHKLLHSVVRLRGARPEVRLEPHDLARLRPPVLLI